MLSDVIQTLLHKRGITDAAEIEKFLEPKYERDVHSPFLLNDMERATARIFAAVSAGEKIGIYTDYDCDGIPGNAILTDFFRTIQYSNPIRETSSSNGAGIENYIPHRDREGYGFHTDAIDALKGRGVSLIITVDVGGAAIDEVAYAQKQGIDVIVCDHHEVTNGIPPAVAVINPKLGEYPFKDLCGAAVAWKLACALLIEGKKRGLANFTSIPEGYEKWLLDLVAIATVADLVPLVGENRALAHFGLKVLRKSKRPGIRALCAVARIRQFEITEDDIGFTFAPRINAASRMDEPEIAFKLLSTNDAQEAESCAAQLESLNRKRKGVVAAMVKDAKARVRNRFSTGERVIVVGDPAWKPSLCGLAANSIMEDRGGIVLVWGKDAHGAIKGSARSDGTMSVVDLFSKAGAAFSEFGGHHASGGFTVNPEAIHTLHETLAAAISELEAKDEVEITTDLEVMLREISTTLMQELQQLAPFGMGNPKPLFRIREARITFARQFGKEMNHTEVSLVCPASGITHRAFQFFKTPMDFTVAPSPGTMADFLATIERDSFRGPDRIALRIEDIVTPRM